MTDDHIRAAIWIAAGRTRITRTATAISNYVGEALDVDPWRVRKLIRAPLVCIGSGGWERHRIENDAEGLVDAMREVMGRREFVQGTRKQIVMF